MANAPQDRASVNDQQSLVRLRAFAPSRRVVVASAALSSAFVLALASGAIAASRADVTLEVDGVSQPVTVWGGTVSTVLANAGVEVGAHDLVQPELGQSAPDGATVVVRRAHPYTIAIDGRARTVWSTSSSADAILADAAGSGSSVALPADRSQGRADLTPLVTRARTVTVNADGASAQVEAGAGDNVNEILARANLALHANDRVDVANGADGGLVITVTRVERGEVAEDVPVAFSTTTASSDALFEGESEVTQTGVNGRARQTRWHESVDGVETSSLVTAEQVMTAPVDEVRSNGTKKATPEALLIAGVDPAAPLENGTDAAGNPSVRYRARIGSISSREQIQQVIDSIPDQANKTQATAAAFRAGLKPDYTGQDPKEIAHMMVAARGWSDSEFQCLVDLWNRESHWNPYAMNASSGAYGIPQSLPGSKMASAGADWQTNPATQITWGIGYIAGRYGTPCAAWGHSNAVGWY